MRIIEPIKHFNRGDLTINITKIINPDCKCMVHGCDKSTLYDVQFEKPENFSNIGGICCKDHLKYIFGIDL